jgi:hypothetical protein
VSVPLFFFGQEVFFMGKDRKDEKLSVSISYCPCLGTYYYRTSDGSERSFFDNDELESTLSSYINQGKVKESEVMARLTTAAREHPHKVLVFDVDGKSSVCEPVVPEWVAGLSKGGE